MPLPQGAPSVPLVRRNGSPRLPRFDSSFVAIIAFIALLHAVGWTTLIAFVAPLHPGAGSKALGIGVGLTAYTLGMRHAFDADHIAAIDNTTRKLVGEGKRTLSVGFWFSFGHSSIVFALTLLIALGVHSLTSRVADAGSAFHSLSSVFGATVSSGFLYLIAALNLFAFLDIYKVFRQSKSGRHDEAFLAQRLEQRGFISRLIAPLMRIVRTPAQMVFVGVLFGLGFDTATEIALLVLTGSGAASGLPWYATLCLPVLFAAGMLLFDTLDGSFMNFAYGWALARPVRRIYYNLVVTGLSVVVALVIGSVEVLGVLDHALKPRGAFWSWTSNLDPSNVGFVIVGLFVATWAVSFAIWKLGRIDERSTPAYTDSPTPNHHLEQSP